MREIREMLEPGVSDARRIETEIHEIVRAVEVGHCSVAEFSPPNIQISELCQMRKRLEFTFNERAMIHPQEDHFLVTGPVFGEIPQSVPADHAAIEKHQISSGKTTSSDFDKLRARLNNRYIEFLQVDLDLGLTMAQIAACADEGSARRERNRRNARRAYNAILELREKVVTTAEQSRQLSLKVRLLHTALVDLGERLQSLPMFA